MTEVLRYAAFAEAPDGGNLAGVVLTAARLSESTMLDIAAQVGYSETAFVVPQDRQPSAFVIRYFSPRAEVAFCGHATVAASIAIAEQRGPGRLAFSTRVGEVLVETERDARGALIATLTSVAPTSRVATRVEVDAALSALGWRRDELDERYPAHVAFAGNHHLVLAAATRSRLAVLDYEMARLDAIMTERGWTTLQLVFAEHDDLFHARNPFPPGGVFEDPATGSAAAALGGYLRVIGRLPDPPQLTVRQGVDMGRPSRLDVTVPPTGGIRVSGRGLRLPDPPDP